ncbi:hypothetical protein B296_00005202 [Ensete ventricosum]|uniref:Uncharacterized protein n=1 Tax=Ensete ventricosum TaxID=4639 RepID=A0A427AYN3_ENSVE|nr:hypothetical protein B296_00005202 [Ensete ventricosum]
MYTPGGWAEDRLDRPKLDYFLGSPEKRKGSPSALRPRRTPRIGMGSHRAFASSGDEALKDALEVLASRFSGLVPPYITEETDLILMEESEEIIPTCSKRK